MQLTFALPAIDFAMWLLVKSGRHVPPFDQHDPTPQIDIDSDLLDPENWTEWCRKIIFIETLMSFKSVFYPYHVSNMELIAKSAQNDAKVDLFIRILDSYPEHYPHQPFDIETIDDWTNFDSLNLPDGYYHLNQHLGALWSRFESEHRVLMQNRDGERAWKIHHWYSSQLVYCHRVVPYVTRVKLELTPYVFMHGEVY
ncbi:hypothetical protein [Pantanalinema sp. GBBB05]|uniref:hypothetical protein n=1 Tax=Pantanalinema sp. GBBB05 TaxID=2604139 RepID=UPI001D7AE1CA|nr:hypothetical protein [Pantanalinema sp. GBBB05]